MKTRAPILYLLLLCYGCFLLGSAAVSADDISMPPSASVSFTLQAGTTFYVGQQIKFQKDTGAVYRSSNSSIASVTATGIVTFKKAGTVTIYVTTRSTGRTKAHQFKVIACTIKLNKTSLTLKKGSSSTLKATVRGPKKKVSWSSGKKAVATVSSSGKVTAKKAGTAVIYAKANGKTARCTVRVTGSSSAKVSLSGLVTNAATGQALGGASVIARSGYNTKNGTAAAKASSSSSGQFTLKLKKGKYTLDISKSGYIRNYVNVNVDGKNGRLSVPITKTIASAKYRVVLSWGNVPADLDLHVTGPQGSTRFHVFWNARVQYGSGVYLAVLDVDDTNGYGPETITLDLSNGTGGTYHFYVHNYTNRKAASSNALAKSGARIDVYKGSSRLASYTVPNRAGLLWQVCDIVNGKLVKINQMGYETSLESGKGAV